MSDYYAKVVVGVPIDKVFEKVTTESKVTRYNSETGAPFEQKLSNTSYLFNGELVFDNSSNKYMGIKTFISKKKLYLYTNGEIIYREIVTGYTYGASEIKQNAIDEIKTLFREELLRLGVNTEPSLYVLLEDSY